MGYQRLLKIYVLSRNVHHKITGYLFQSTSQSYYTDTKIHTEMVSLLLVNTITTAINPGI